MQCGSVLKVLASSVTATTLVLALAGCSLLSPAAPAGLPTLSESALPPPPSPPPLPLPPPPSPPLEPILEPKVTTPAAFTSWDQTMEAVASGVARITAVRCTSGGSGTGFLVAPDLIATAAHVVKDQVALSVVVNGQVTSAAVVARDDVQDLALIRTYMPIEGHVFDFAAPDPVAGSATASIGYPLGQPIGIADGIVSGLDRKFQTAFGLQEHLVQTSAPVNPGNSGGPLVNMAGQVVGVISAKSELTGDGRPVENMGYAVTASAAAPMVIAWMARTTTVGTAQCDSNTETDSSSISAFVRSDEPEAVDIAQVLLAHGQAINIGAYDAAFSYFTSSTKGVFGSAESWGAGLTTSFWTRLVLENLVRNGDDATATVVLTTTQSADPGEAGQECSNATYDYLMKRKYVQTPYGERGNWFIEQVNSMDPEGLPAAC